MASIDFDRFNKDLDKFAHAAIDKVVREYAADGVLMFPYCPDCKTLMTKRGYDSQTGDEIICWFCECELA